MLAHKANKWNSSALGRYQIVHTTRRNIQKALGIPATALFDQEMQDRMVCFLLGQRGVDKYLAGRLQRDIESARHDERWRHMDEKIEQVGKKVDKISSDLSPVAWLLIAGIIMAAIAFLVRGGFAPQMVLRV